MKVMKNLLIPLPCRIFRIMLGVDEVPFQITTHLLSPFAYIAYTYIYLDIHIQIQIYTIISNYIDIQYMYIYDNQYCIGYNTDNKKIKRIKQPGLILWFKY